MKKTNRFFLSNIWLIVSFISLILAYCLLQPRISNIFPFIRQYRLNSFIANTKKNNSISVQEFWQLREFYSPGIIRFNRPELIFTSQLISSTEKIVPNSTSLYDLIPKTNLGKVLYKSKNELISQEGDRIYIYFIKSISEIKNANGFYDYVDKDKKLFENKSYFTVASFTTN